MSHGLVPSAPVEEPTDLELPPAFEPSPEVDARIRRLGHAALLSARSRPNISRLELSLSAVLIASYAVYAAGQVVLLFTRGV